MQVEVIMPAMEMDQESARVIRWLKEPGERVLRGEPLIEIETDKVTVEIEAPETGTLTSVTAGAGEDVAVGTTIALIVDDDAPTTSPENRVRETPRGQRLGAETDVDLSRRVVRSDGPDRTANAGPVYREIPLEAVRKRAAERLLASYQQAPHIALRRTIDATRLLATVEDFKRRGTKASVLATVAEATAATLTTHPRLNAHLVEGVQRIFDHVGLGIAVALEEGVIVPVIREAEELDIPAIAAEIERLAKRARAGKLEPADVRGGTFTISNLGMFAVDDFTPILNPPEVGILALGAVRKTAGRPTTSLTLVVDHRAIDGAVAARFLTDLTARLEGNTSI